MRIDVIDVLGVDAAILQSIFHRPGSTMTFFVWLRNVSRIAARTKTENFAVDLRAACFGVLELFEDE